MELLTENQRIGTPDTHSADCSPATLKYNGRNSNHMVNKITEKKLSILGLFRGDYQASFHVRQMAALLRVSHPTLLPHLHDLEKDSILRSSLAGRNKQYSLRLDNVAAREHILLAEKTAALDLLDRVPLLQRIRAEIADLALPGSFVLFGSYAKGTFTSASDIDILYIGPEQDALDTLRKLGKTYGKRLSVQTTSLPDFEEWLRKRNPLFLEVLADHVLLENAEPFVNAVWRHYRDRP